MFQNITNFLLGSFTNNGPTTTNDVGTADEGVENHNVRLTPVEDEWMMVERDSEGNSDASSVDSFDYEEVNGMELVKRPPTSLLTRTSSSSSLPCTANMDESWFVTPPPCFTSTGPIHLETSPFENLLIEHPSMSVYTHHRNTARNYNVPVSDRASDSSSPPRRVPDEIIVSEADDGESEVIVVVHTTTPRINRTQVIQQQEKQGLKNKQAQKLQIKKACEVMKRGYMDRNNKAREVNSRNRRQRRGERSQGATRSYANNNRKC